MGHHQTIKKGFCNRWKRSTQGQLLREPIVKLQAESINETA